MKNAIMRIVSRIRLFYWWLVRPVTIGAKVLVFCDNKVLLIKLRYQKYWVLPGGGVRKGETAADCAKREVLEETGVELPSVQIFNLFSNFSEYKSDHIALFCTELEKEPSLAKADLEVEQAEFFKIDTLPEDISPATKRRLEEYLANNKNNHNW